MNLTTITLIAIFFIIAIAFSFAKPKYIPSRALFLLRALFPSWRFFEEITEVPSLFYRIKRNKNEFGPWEECLKKPKRGLSSFFLNADANLLFAYGGLLQHFIHDLESVDEKDTEAFMNSVSYRLLTNLARFNILENNTPFENSDFQFKICTALQGDEEEILDDVLISATHKI